MTNPSPPSRNGVPALPREDWPEHPNYPRQLLLLGSHANFLRINRQLVQLARDGASARSIESYFRRWIAAMRSHEAYEERKLYPYLSARWGADFSAARDGHEALHEAFDLVVAACRADDADVLTAALEAHHAVLEDHLRLEEELVIPLLLELPPEEFDVYLTLPASAISPIDA